MVSMALIFPANSSYSVFLTTLSFTALLSLLKSTRVVSNCLIYNLSTLIYKSLKLIGTFFNLSISNLSTSDFKLAKLVLFQHHFLTPVAPFAV